MSGLGEAHLAACRAAPADPDDLAHWLVAQALGELGELVDIEPHDYEEVLGTQGIARVRELALAAWRDRPHGWAEKDLVERLARVAGDVDAVIALYAADLDPDGSTHGAIARELDAAGRPDEALSWAERGLAETPSPADRSLELIEYLCARYARGGRLAAAVELRRGYFAAHRTLAAYQQLREAARAADVWPAEREHALAALRAEAAAHGGNRYRGPVLVDALLDDEALGAAWQAATECGADDTQWLVLADRVRATRPGDALDVYLRLVEPLTRRTGAPVYERLTSLILSIRDCHRGLGEEEAFAEYVTALRADQRRKRNLMAMLDAHGL
ncbi:hypothetical protein ACFCVY_29355 [Streptomyces sp. NPDC056411]|uniref:hypothetical protein n=1 Tax=Streptomyces sp. NPDC056411 TaxID=3345813 RepID=UPI0035D9685F